MRAMPSPTERTVPTSATSTVVVKLPIWSRISLEISSARICMGTLCSFRVRANAARSRLLCRQLLAQPLDLSCDAAVEDQAADARNHAAENIGIDALVNRHVASHRFRQRAGQRR